MEEETVDAGEYTELLKPLLDQVPHDTLEEPQLIRDWLC